MTKISDHEVSFLLAHWLDWTFIPELLNTFTKDTLKKFADEYDDYEFGSEYSEEIWKEAWILYFDLKGTLTEDIEEIIDSL